MKKPWYKRGFLWGTVAYFSFSLIIQAVLGESPVGVVFRYIDVLKFRNDLRAARERWEEVGPSHYQVKIREGHFIDESGYDCYLQRDPVVVFKDGKAISGDKWADCQEAYNQITVEKIFDQIEREVTSRSPFFIHWRVEFDPDFGYVSSYYIRCVDTVVLSDNHCQEDLDTEDFGWKSFGFAEFLVIESGSQ